MFKLLLVGMLLGNGADAASSVVAFRGGAIELNPFVMSTKTTPFLVQTGVFTAVETGMAFEARKKHPKLVNTLLAVAIAGSVAATVNNIQVIRAQHRR